jgi:hypothetical protein
MKHLFCGMALSAALAVAAPAFAQAPMTPSEPNPPSSRSEGWVQPAPGSDATPVPPRPHRRSAHRLPRYHGHWRSSADHMANRLNRQELRGGVWYGSVRSYDGPYGPKPNASSGK